ncbi:hypothetical protein FBUS_08418 [Fasciolopsis buskii]|uniref:Uncharacterized protein n=1 Tax=Fasciolopsis buskii TaxID=27845 RepID=A0A8E0S5H1_9TREM|nr:hypothetical protein FBUS_08418 [Fasciolopsis buski]
MHMLQRSMKLVSGGTVPVSGSPVVGTSLPRVLTIRSPAQVGSGGAVLGEVSGVAPVRPGTIILSGAGGLSHLGSATFQTADEIDNSIVLGSNTEGVQPPGLLTASPGYYDLATGIPAPGGMAGYLQPGSPSGRDSGDEQEHMPTGLKTNGLRRYARCVCNKVKEKGVTSYSEVADELVHEYAAEHPMIPSEQLHYIQKNIRRRVYDALNVLMALNVLQKEKKEIRWVGLPVNMIEECRRLEEEREKRQVSLRNKTLEIQDLILQLIAFKNLVMRNRINDRYRRSQTGNDDGPTLPESQNHSSASSQARTEKIPLPFLVISTNRKTVIDCNISNDKLEYVFNFDQAFEIRDEVDTLKRMGLMLRLGTIHCTQEDYNQCLELVPPSLRFYVEGNFAGSCISFSSITSRQPSHIYLCDGCSLFQIGDHVSTKSNATQACRDDGKLPLGSSTARVSAHCNVVFGFYLFHVRGLRYGNIPTTTLSTLLNPVLGPLESSAQFNFLFDLEWLLQQYPEHSRNAPLLIVHGAQGQAKKNLEAECAAHTNIECIQFGSCRPTHHSIWISPLLLRTDLPTSATDSSTHFRQDLVRYLRSYGSEACQSPTSKIGRWIDLLCHHDFRPVRVFLIASSSGAFTGSDMSKFGHLRLAEVNLMFLRANLSKAAWGVLQKNGTELAMRSYELGVLFMPSQFEPNSNCFPLEGPPLASKNVNDQFKLPDSMRPSSVAFPRPYQLPPESYGDNGKLIDAIFSVAFPVTCFLSL